MTNSNNSKTTDWARIEQACREYAESKYAVRALER
jgi:hypothetical protein